jgi:primosomal protein N' (replication factor Y)
MTNRCVNVLLPSLKSDRLLTYLVPSRFLGCSLIGSRVLVPVRHRREIGIVVADVESTGVMGIKEIIDVPDPVPAFDPPLLDLTRWVADYYLASWGEVIRAALPTDTRRPGGARPVVESTVRPTVEDPGRVAVSLEKRAPKQAACLRLLKDGPRSLAHLREQGIDARIIKILETKGMVTLDTEERYREPFDMTDCEPPKRLLPTPEQSSIISRIADDLQKRMFAPTLLHGVTGSGKTLIYIEVIERVVAEGRGAIVLIPEISLTPQTVRRFRSRFGQGIAVLHSRLSDGERYDAWRQILSGERRIVIGARSAIFAPVRNLGLIIVDEEHDTSYKQHDPSPRYHARDVAMMRGKLVGTVVLLGSATPSLESYHHATTGRYRLLTLPFRIDKRPLPSVTVVDIRDRTIVEKKGIISTPLREKIASRLERGERVILLQNRRGYSTCVQCRDCGFVVSCRRCQVAMTFHSAGHLMLCHYCGSSRQAPTLCRSCRSHNLRYGGTGTQRVEITLTEIFSGVRVIRMDTDTTRRKHAHRTLLDRFEHGEADILLGTQMVTKGLDFPEVTLVGVISADTSLNLPDFRAGERTFQLLTQVAGRAGRGTVAGEVIIQTYKPDDQAIHYATTHDFRGFADTEMVQRREAGYPPFGRLIVLLFRGKEESHVQEVAERYATHLRKANTGGVEILGPAQAPIVRIKDHFRWQLLMKGQSSKVMHSLVATVDGVLRSSARECGVRVNIDVDPVGLL